MTVIDTAKAPTSDAIRKSTADALRRAYLLIFDKAPVSHVDIVDGCRFNNRYAREVVGTLLDAELITIEEDPESGDMIYFDEEVFTKAGLAVNEQSAQEVIDGWLEEHLQVTQPAPPRTPPTATHPRPTKAQGSGECRCGCGRPTKGLFAPGHDARMAGDVAREIAGRRDQNDHEAVDDLLASLPTEALRAKAMAHANRLLAKGSKAVAASAPTENDRLTKVAKEHGLDHYTYGVVKIGKNRFAARRDADGVIMRHNKALPNEVVPLATYAELDYTSTVEGNVVKSFRTLEVQP